MRATDFGLAAKLDPRAPWVKVSVLLFQYISNMDENITSANATTFAGRKEKVATKLQKDVVLELVAEPDFAMSVDAFIKDMLDTYKPPNANEQMERDLLTTYGEFLANTGRRVIGIVALRT